MLPWANKSGESSGSSSIRSDQNLATGSRFTSQDQTTTSGSRFRTQPKPVSNEDQALNDRAFDQFIEGQSPASLNAQSPQSPAITAPYTAPISSSMLPTDGAEVAALLNSSAYTEVLHSDDLQPDSSTYSSYRHDFDTQHSLAEIQRQRLWEDLLRADDLVAYLQQNLKYTDDIYGLPEPVESLVKEARQEVVQEDQQNKPRRAVERLDMLRNHLMGRANGNAQEAARQSYQLQADEWAKIFSSGI